MKVRFYKRKTKTNVNILAFMVNSADLFIIMFFKQEKAITIKRRFHLWVRWIRRLRLIFSTEWNCGFCTEDIKLPRKDTWKEMVVAGKWGKETRIWSTTQLVVSFLFIPSLLSHGIDSTVAQNPVRHNGVNRKILKRSPHFLVWKVEKWTPMFRWAREGTVLFLLFSFSPVQLIVILQRDNNSQGGYSSRIVRIGESFSPKGGTMVPRVWGKFPLLFLPRSVLLQFGISLTKTVARSTWLIKETKGPAFWQKDLRGLESVEEITKRRELKRAVT